MLAAMQISLERDTAAVGRPVYRQIADHILAEIRAERLSAGERLPAIRQLAQRLGVNRDTVALAYEELANAGLVESTVGRGTFVAAPAGEDSGPFEPLLSPVCERLLPWIEAKSIA